MAALATAPLVAGDADLEESVRREAEREDTLLSRVLEAEATALERTIATAGMAATGIGLLMSLYTIVASGFSFGGPLALVAAGALAYFTLLRAWLRRGRGGQLMWLAPVAEVTIPFIATITMCRSQGIAYTLGSWVPPLLFSWLVLVSTLRLRPWMPVIAGAASATAFALLAFWVLPALDPTPLPDTELYSARMQMARSLNLFLIGGMGAVISRALRTAFSRGAREVRAQDLFGKYRLGREIAVGGMGTVLEATYCPEGGFERPVAVKRIHPHLARDPRFIQSFRQEAEIGARLVHPRIVQVVDFGQAHGTYFLAMEFIDGWDLARVIDRASLVDLPIPASLVARIGLDIAEALQFAHEGVRGADGEVLRVVHRDLSPRNVMVSRMGEVKLTDFGIARALKDSATHRTQQMMGSLAYLSPEQAKGEPHDERADLFALGAVLFELLTLRSLFRRETDVGTLRAVIDADIPDVVSRRPGLDVGWRRVLARCLAADPAHRYPSASDAIEDLKVQLEREGRPGPHDLRDWLAEVWRREVPTDRLRSPDDIPTDSAALEDAVTAVDYGHSEGLHDASTRIEPED